MVAKPRFPELLQLSAAERIQLAQDLWDSIVDEPHAWTLSESQRIELDRRLQAYREASLTSAPADLGSDWETVRRRVIGGD